jgi:hypothetical protein
MHASDGQNCSEVTTFCRILGESQYLFIFLKCQIKKLYIGYTGNRVVTLLVLCFIIVI